jgi:hypothetical protein
MYVDISGNTIFAIYFMGAVPVLVEIFIHILVLAAANNDIPPMSSYATCITSV